MKNDYKIERNFTWPPKKFGCLWNTDSDEIARFAKSVDWDFSDIEKKADSYFDKFARSGISDFIYDIAPSVPTENEQWYGERYLRTEERGVPVNNKEHPTAKASYMVYCENHFDAYGLWFKKVWESGRRPWISFRMNDVHYANEPTGHSEFFYKARDNGWMVGDYHHPRYWYGYALDYSVPEVREHFLAVIAETVGKYDAFGVELDFSRTIRCFKDEDPANAEYMTEFMQRLREVLAGAEKQWGHPWRILLRISTRVSLAYLYGFDVRRYAREKLVDGIVASAYWGSSDSCIPISEWKEILPPEIPVFWAIEANTFNYWHFISPETIGGYAKSAEGAGADGLYQFNSFNVPWAWDIYDTETADKIPVNRYLLTLNDIPVAGYFEPEAKYLPVTVTNRSLAEFTMPVGKLKAGEPIKIFLGITVPEGADKDAAAEKMAVFCNGYRLTYLGRNGESYMEKYYAKLYEEQETKRYPWRVFAYEVPAEGIGKIGKDAKITVTSKTEVTVCYLEIANGTIV